VKVDRVLKPILLEGQSTHGNLLAENPEAEWIELAGEGISIINSVKIPEEHMGHMDVSPYLANTRGAQGAGDAKPVSGVEAGFLIRTTGKTPDGDHVLHNTILFAINPNSRKEYLENAIKLLRKKLIINPVTLAQ
jgi:hypothetical protein